MVIGALIGDGRDGTGGARRGGEVGGRYRGVGGGFWTVRERQRDGGGGGRGDGMGMEARMGNFAVRGVERGVLLCTEDKVWTLQTTMGKKKIQHRCEVCGTNGAHG